MKPKDPKRCTKCGEHKPRAEFYPHSKAKNGVSAWCRDCTKRVATEKQKADKDGVKVRNRKSRLKRAFGLTLEQYDEMLGALRGGSLPRHRKNSRPSLQPLQRRPWRAARFAATSSKSNSLLRGHHGF